MLRIDRAQKAARFKTKISKKQNVLPAAWVGAHEKTQPGSLAWLCRQEIIMIKYYFKSIRSQAMSELEQPKPGTWVHAEAPNEAELAELAKRFKLEEGYLQDALDEDEVPPPGTRR